jgi:hypothetical protein
MIITIYRIRINNADFVADLGYANPRSFESLAITRDKQ